MSSAITKTSKRCPPLDKPPKDMTTKQLKKIFDRYQDYLNAMCNEDGYVNQYDRTINLVGPYFAEYEKRTL